MANNLWWSQSNIATLTATTQALSSTEAIIHLNSNNRLEVYTTGITQTVAWETDLITAAGTIKDYIYVSPIGNDSTGTGVMNKPYATLEYAIGVATSGKTIYVEAGTYTPTANIAKDGVDWYFDHNTYINITTGTSYLFYIVSFVNSTYITGYGNFTVGGSVGLIASNSLTNTVYFEANSVINTGSVNSFFLANKLGIVNLKSHYNSGAGCNYILGNGSLANNQEFHITCPYEYNNGTNYIIYDGVASGAPIITFIGNMYKITNQAAISLVGLIYTHYGDIIANAIAFNGTARLTIYGNNLKGDITCQNGDVYSSLYYDDNSVAADISCSGILNMYSETSGMRVTTSGRVNFFGYVHGSSGVDTKVLPGSTGIITFNGYTRPGGWFDCYGTIVLNGETLLAAGNSLWLNTNAKLYLNNKISGSGNAAIETWGTADIYLGANSSIENNDVGIRFNAAGNLICRGGTILSTTNSIVTQVYAVSVYNYQNIFAKAAVSGLYTRMITGGGDIIIDNNVTK